MPLKSATCGRELEAGLRRRPGSNNVTFDGKPLDGVFVMHRSKMPGADAYATSKQCNLATAMVFARETPRLHFNAVEPGVNLATGLGHRDANGFARAAAKYALPLLVPLLMPFMRFLRTPKHAARVITNI